MRRLSTVSSTNFCTTNLAHRRLSSLVYPVSKVLQCLILEKRGIIPRCSRIDKILDIANLMKRGIKYLYQVLCVGEWIIGA